MPIDLNRHSPAAGDVELEVVAVACVLRADQELAIVHEGDGCCGGEHRDARILVLPRFPQALRVPGATEPPIGGPQFHVCEIGAQAKAPYLLHPINGQLVRVCERSMQAPTADPAEHEQGNRGGGCPSSTPALHLKADHVYLPLSGRASRTPFAGTGFWRRRIQWECPPHRLRTSARPESREC